jgi:hypothetical protein
MGELAAMALALENPHHILLLDDLLARKTAIAAGIPVWGTLRVILEAKSSGLLDRVDPIIKRLMQSGMWISEDLRLRILALAGEE